jgi:hypothetical protein
MTELARTRKNWSNKTDSCAEDSEGSPKFFSVVRILPTFY